MLKIYILEVAINANNILYLTEIIILILMFDLYILFCNTFFFLSNLFNNLKEQLTFKKNKNNIEIKR